jgi:hypothetical protein
VDFDGERWPWRLYRHRSGAGCGHEKESEAQPDPAGGAGPGRTDPAVVVNHEECLAFREPVSRRTGSRQRRTSRASLSSGR